jgi:hypothetical protein
MVSHRLIHKNCALFAAGLLVGSLLLTGACAADSVVSFAGEHHTREQFERESSPRARLAGLYDWIWGRVLRDYVQRNALGASAAEQAELEAYDEEFTRRDRAQRARKLIELDQRLSSEKIGSADRAWLTEFRDTLRRLTEHDRRQDAEPPPADERARWRRVLIEFWKVSRLLHQQYGGVVTMTPLGPFPHDARVALLDHYERNGVLVFNDAGLRDEFFAPLRAAPGVTVPPHTVDFTPYWQQPIPASYFPDEVARP